MERLMLDYLPQVLREVRDYQCLMGRYQEALSLLWRKEREVEDNFYLETADERGLVHWENILGIAPWPGSSIEERRQVIRARQSQTTPYCLVTFHAFLTALTGRREAYEAELNGLTLTVWLAPTWRWMREAVWDLMRWVVPANIEMRLISVYNTHRQLGAMTHRQMAAMTHKRLRSEVDLI